MNSLNKIAYWLIIVFITVSVFLPQIIRFRYVIFVFALSFIAAISSLPKKHSIAAIPASLIAIVLFLGYLPTPYAYLIGRNIPMSISILATALTGFAYVSVIPAIIQLIAGKYLAESEHERQ